MKRFTLGLFLLAGLFLSHSVPAADVPAYDSFSSPNYVWIDREVKDPSLTVSELQNRLRGKLAYLYISGCGLDAEALPVFQQLAKENPETLFLRIGQFSVARPWLAEQFNMSGAPNIYLLKDGRILSVVSQYYTAAYQHIGWGPSLKRWFAYIHKPSLPLGKLPNIHTLDDATWSQLMIGKSTIVLRMSPDYPDLPIELDALAKAAAAFPDVTFVVDTGGASCAGISAVRFAWIIDCFGLVCDRDTLADTFRRKRGSAGYDTAELHAWIKAAVAKKNPAPLYTPNPPPADTAQFTQFLRNREIPTLAAIPPARLAPLIKAVNWADFDYFQYADIILAIASSRTTNSESARLWLEVLEFNSLGGIKALVKQPIPATQNYYVKQFKRLKAFETRPAVIAAFDRLIPLYAEAVKVEPPVQPMTAPASNTAPVPTAPASADKKKPNCVLNAGVADADFASPFEIEILAELNLVRSNPKSYTAFLRQYRERINGKVLKLPNGKKAQLKEGVKAVDEAIRQLSSARSLSALSLSRGMSRGARDHALDLVRTVRTGHNGSDGTKVGARVNRYGTWKTAVGENISYGSTSAREFVISLLVDDGVADRGHRKNILEPRYFTAGIAVEMNHPNYGPICVQTFASAYIEKP